MKSNVRAIFWEFSARYCASCKEEKYAIALHLITRYDPDLTNSMMFYNRICSGTKLPQELAPSRHRNPFPWLTLLPDRKTIHYPEMEQFVALYNKTRKKDRKKLLQDRIDLVSRVQYVSQHLFISLPCSFRYYVETASPRVSRVATG